MIVLHVRIRNTRDPYSLRSLTISLVNASAPLCLWKYTLTTYKRNRFKVGRTSARNVSNDQRNEINRAQSSYLVKSRGRMMVLPGRHRVGTYARVGAGKINGQDFAVARRRAYRVCRSVWARHNFVPRVRSGRRGQRGSGTRRGKRRQGVASDVDRRRFLMETATRIGRRISRPSRWRRCIRGWLQPRTAGRVGIVRAAILLHLYIRQLWLTFLHSNDSVDFERITAVPRISIVAFARLLFIEEKDRANWNLWNMLQLSNFQNVRETTLEEFSDIILSNII